MLPARFFSACFLWLIELTVSSNSLWRNSIASWKTCWFPCTISSALLDGWMAASSLAICEQTDSMFCNFPFAMSKQLLSAYPKHSSLCCYGTHRLRELMPPAIVGSNFEQLIEIVMTFLVDC